MNACCTVLVCVRHEYAYSETKCGLMSPATAEASVTSARRPAWVRARTSVRLTSQRTSSHATAMPRKRKAMTNPPWRFAHASRTSGIAYRPRQPVRR